MTRRVVAITAATAVTDPRVRKEADALAEAGYEVTVIAWDRAGDAPRVADMGGWTLESLGPVARHGAGLRNIGHYRTFWSEATARALELAPHFVHCHNLDSMPAALRIRSRQQPHPFLVADFHEIYRESRALPQRGVVGTIARAAARVLERRAISASDLVVTVVEAQVDYYRRLGARSLLVLENAPDLALYTPVMRDEPEFVVSFIGQKRFMPALENLMLAVQSLPGIRALLVGGGPGEAEVARMAGTLDRIEVSGRIEPEDVPILYHSCDAVYACYDDELLNWRTSFPVKVMEGMACGLPVIVTAGTYIAEYVERSGIGLAVDYRDVQAIAAALDSLLSDRAAARAMGARGRAIAERELNWEAVSARLVRAYGALGVDGVN